MTVMTTESGCFRVCRCLTLFRLYFFLLIFIFPMSRPFLSRATAPLLRPACRPQSMLARRRLLSTGQKPQPQFQRTEKSNRMNIILATLFIGASAGVYYWESVRMGVIPGKSKDEFTVAVGSGPNRQSVTFERKTPEEQEHMLTVNEKTTVPARLGNPVARWDTNFVASNEPCEDRHAADLVPRTTKPGAAEGSRDLVVVSVIDGHAGDQTSDLLSKTLHPTVALGFAALESGIVPGQTWYGKMINTLSWGKVWSPPNVAKSIESS